MKTSIALLLLALPTLPLAAASQGSTRPPEVPASYVITPFGFFDPSCVRHIAEGETVLADGRVQHGDGSVDRVAPMCASPSYSATGAPRSAGNSYGETREPATNGWVEYVSAVTASSYGMLKATWKVPPAPTNVAGQTLFYFPGFEDINDVQSIVQPVLQFGPSEAGGGNYWAVASWNCCLAGIADYSTPVTVSSGDTIEGVIGPNCATGACGNWTIISGDLTTGASTSLKKSTSDGQVWNWAFGAVMEVYGVSTCADYPPNSGIAFSVKLWDTNENPIADPAWTESPARGISPSCGFSLGSTPTVEAVKYQN